MSNSLSRSVGWYLDYYCDFIASWWAHISYWEYIVVMILCLGAGWVMLRRPIHGFS